MKNFDKPLVVVNVPVYNGEEFIEDALQSLINQSYQNFVCNVINNCSKDKTSEIVEKITHADQRFKLHNYTNFVDICSNWNRCLEHIPAEAKYLKILQADDILFNKAIEELVLLLEQHPSAGIGSSYRLAENVAYGVGLDFLDGNFYNGKEILGAHVYEKMEITGSVTQLMFRIESLKKLSFFPDVFIHDDNHFDTRLAYEMFNISDLVFCFQVLSYSRRHAKSSTMTIVYRFNTLLQAKEARLYRFKELYPEYKDKYKEIRSKYAYFILKQKILRKKDCLNWHKKYNKRQFTSKELIVSFFKEFGPFKKIFK